jgi:hypothetical protein
VLDNLRDNTCNISKGLEYGGGAAYIDNENALQVKRAKYMPLLISVKPAPV